MSERDEFGPALRRERERRGITLQDIANQTKIGASLFAGLERNDVSRWPCGIYRRSFLRAYASAIGLDGERLVEQFRRLFPEDGDEAVRAAGRRGTAKTIGRPGGEQPSGRPGSSDARGNGLRLQLDATSAAPSSRAPSPARAPSSLLRLDAASTRTPPVAPALRLQLESAPAATVSWWSGARRRALIGRAAALAVDLTLVAVVGALVLAAYGWPAVWPAMAAASCILLVAAPVLVRTTPGTWLLVRPGEPPAVLPPAEATRRRVMELHPVRRRHRAAGGAPASSDSAQGRHAPALAVAHGHKRAARRPGK